MFSLITPVTAALREALLKEWALETLMLRTRHHIRVS
jgi:hypothetical protein